MKGNKDVIQFLNKILKNELTAINQYFLHSRIIQDWGLDSLAKKIYDESIEERQHADLLIKRILFLGGLPNLQDLNKIFIGQNIQEIFESDLKLELSGHKDLIEAVQLAEEVKDFVSRELFVKIMDNEEEHIDWLETQLKLIKNISAENYQSQFLKG